MTNIIIGALIAAGAVIVFMFGYTLGQIAQLYSQIKEGRKRIEQLEDRLAELDSKL